LLSSDNGFIGRWGNRTLLARFGPVQPFDDGQSHHKAALLPGARRVERRVEYTAPDMVTLYAAFRTALALARG